MPSPFASYFDPNARQGATDGRPGTSRRCSARPCSPGDVGRFAFDVTGPDQPGATITESFQLQVPGGGPISCPAGEITPSILITPGAGGATGANGGASTGGATGSATSSPRGCSASPTGGEWAWGAEVTLAFLALARARRGRSRRQAPGATR